jgi:A/G-specific adenine glycosylase
MSTPFTTPHKELLDWYAKEGRHELPWRNTDNIYHIYLSEIMLQQTQVKRVRDEYYPQFLEKFPTLQALGEAPLERVLSAWSGLGYYRRAKNLHALAQQCPQGLPITRKELKALPGIGEYTASAICSFGLLQQVGVVDTNIARVLKRYFALLNQGDKVTWHHAERFLNQEKPREHNLALMDLGSLICTPKSPKCSQCPLESSCEGKEDAERYTQVKKKKSIKMDLFFGVCIKGGKIALEYSRDNMYKAMLVLPQVDPIEEDLLGSFKHAYTKYRLNVKIYKVEALEGDYIWLERDKFDTAPISSLTKKAKIYMS